MRVVLGIFLVWMSGAVCFGAAPVWRWSNPTPHGAHIYALASRGSAVVQVGEFGQAFLSDDLEQWRPLSTGVTNHLRSATWFGSRLVITGSGGLILYSDTLNTFTNVDLGVTDWVEGVANSETRLVAVGDNGAIYTSVDATTWERRPNAAEWLRSVAYGNDMFIAVGDKGFVTASADGLQWTSRPRLGSKDLNRVVWSGDRFWILGNEGTAYQSTSGSNWLPLNVSTTNDLFSAAYNGSEAVIVGRGELLTSPAPFLFWDSQIDDSPAPPAWTYYAALWDGAEFLVGGRSGMFVEGFKPAGSSKTEWFANSDAPRNWIWGLKRMGGLYIGCGEQGGIFTSVDGFRFDQEAVPESASTSLLEGIGGTSNLVIAVGTQGTILWSEGGYTNVVTTNSTGQLVTNEVNLLGIVWNKVTPEPTIHELQGVGVFGSTYIVTGGQGTILTSDNGRGWLQRLSGVTKMLSSVAASESRAVIVGDTGTVLTSENGILWAPRSSGVTNWIYHVTHDNGQFVAVGEEGVILTSEDGLDWRRRASGTTKWLNNVTFEHGNYYAVGSQGTVLRSPDAVQWGILPQWTTKSLYAAAGDRGQLVAAGLEGAVLRTRLVGWTVPVNFLSFSVTTNAQAFLFSGQLDERFTLQRSPDLQRWFDIADLEMLDNSGAQSHFEAPTSGAKWFFRARAIDP